MTSKITVVGGIEEPKTKRVEDIEVGTAFTGSLMGRFGSPYTGIFLKQGRNLVGLGVVGCHNEGNVFFDNAGTVENYQEVDLEIKVVPHVS